MDRRRNKSLIYARQWSGGSNSTGSSSPTMLPAHPQSRLGTIFVIGLSTVKRTQNVTAKAAALRLAHVMASQNTTANDGEDAAVSVQYQLEDQRFQFACLQVRSFCVFDYASCLNRLICDVSFR
ncbi:hypothetical protein GYH30_015755 [Glycine max]|nr:hypothetical protein GYH30_015755 [Glycine max]